MQELLYEIFLLFLVGLPLAAIGGFLFKLLYVRPDPSEDRVVINPDTGEAEKD